MSLCNQSLSPKSGAPGNHGLSFHHRSLAIISSIPGFFWCDHGNLGCSATWHYDKFQTHSALTLPQNPYPPSPRSPGEWYLETTVRVPRVLVNASLVIMARPFFKARKVLTYKATFDSDCQCPTQIQDMNFLLKRGNPPVSFSFFPSWALWFSVPCATPHFPYTHSSPRVRMPTPSPEI